MQTDLYCLVILKIKQSCFVNQNNTKIWLEYQHSNRHSNAEYTERLENFGEKEIIVFAII